MFRNIDVNIDEKLWETILKDPEITTDTVQNILFYILKQPNCEAAGSEIANALNYSHHAALNSIVPAFSKRIMKKYPFVRLSERGDNTKRFWHIPFLHRKNYKPGLFVWILRPELVNALINVLKNDKEINDKIFAPTNDHKVFNDSVGLIKRLNIEYIPEGTKVPEKKTQTTETFVRNPQVHAAVQRRANGVCELCKKKSPFKDKNGDPYLESHHIQYLSLGGEDTMRNTVAVCPNCHRELHSGEKADEKKTILERLFMKKMNSLKTPLGNIKITINDIETAFFVKELEKKEFFYWDGEIYFEVDERYLLIADIENIDPLVIDCYIEDINYNGTNVASGEVREMTCFYLDNLLLCIGVETVNDEDYWEDIIYLENGFRMLNYEKWGRKDIQFGIAWKLINDHSIEDYYVEEAAQPPYQNLWKKAKKHVQEKNHYKKTGETDLTNEVKEKR